MSQEKGLLGIFDHPEKLVEAVRKMRSTTQLKKFETFTPFPIHGLEHVMGLKRSWIPWATFVLGLLGCVLGFAFQSWTSAVSWPLNIGGKPLVSWPAFIPVTFETTILIGGVGTVLTLFFAMRLPCYSKKVLDERLSNDHFALFIDASDPQFDEGKISSMLKEWQASEVKVIDPATLKGPFD